MIILMTHGDSLSTLLPLVWTSTHHCRRCIVSIPSVTLLKQCQKISDVATKLWSQVNDIFCRSQISILTILMILFIQWLLLVIISQLASSFVLRTLWSQIIHFQFIYDFVDEVLHQLQHLDFGKATGSDGASTFFLKTVLCEM